MQVVRASPDPDHLARLLVFNTTAHLGDYLEHGGIEVFAKGIWNEERIDQYLTGGLYRAASEAICRQELSND